MFIVYSYYKASTSTSTWTGFGVIRTETTTSKPWMFRVITIFLGKFRGKVLKLNLPKKLLGGDSLTNHHHFKVYQAEGTGRQKLPRRGSLQNRLFLLEKGQIPFPIQLQLREGYIYWLVVEPTHLKKYVRQIGNPLPQSSG